MSLPISGVVLPYIDESPMNPPPAIAVCGIMPGIPPIGDIEAPQPPCCIIGIMGGADQGGIDPQPCCCGICCCGYPPPNGACPYGEGAGVPIPGQPFMMVVAEGGVAIWLNMRRPPLKQRDLQTQSPSLAVTRPCLLHNLFSALSVPLIMRHRYHLRLLSSPCLALNP